MRALIKRFLAGLFIGVLFVSSYAHADTVTYSCGDGDGTAPESQSVYASDGFTPAKYSGCYANDANGKARMFTGWRVRINGVDTDDVLFPGQAIDWNYTDNVTLVAQYEISPFSVTTIDMQPNATFSFSMTTIGKILVDWGDGSSEHIVQLTTDRTVYSHTFTDSGSKTIRFIAESIERYVELPEYDDLEDADPRLVLSSISFNGNQLVESTNGSLFDLFPIIEGGSLPGESPTFIGVFKDCKNLVNISALFKSNTYTPTSFMFAWALYGCSALTAIPDDLFGGISGGAERVFKYTFRDCTSITYIPEGLFNGVYNTATMYTAGMFMGTFNGCSGFGTDAEHPNPIPENLFGGIKVTDDDLFKYTFGRCRNLKQIPENLFASIDKSIAEGTNRARNMFAATFNLCEELESIPAGLFNSINGTAPGLFNETFKSCHDAKLTTIPNGLFGNIKGELQENMFKATFMGCYNLKTVVINGDNIDPIPEGLFNGVSGAAKNAFNATFKNCTKIIKTPEFFSEFLQNSAEGMFEETFSGCTRLESVSKHIFLGTSGAAKNLFKNTFAGCSALQSVPIDLFVNTFDETFDINNAEGMFNNTFRGCDNLAAIELQDEDNRSVSYIPSKMFGSLMTETPDTTDFMTGMFLDTALLETCPSGTDFVSSIYYTKYWQPKVMCQPKTYSVILDANGGQPGTVTTISPVYSALMPNVGGGVNLPTLYQHSFAGYWTSPETGGEQYYDNTGVAKIKYWEATNINTLYARWTRDTYTVTYSCGDGDGTAPESQSVYASDGFTPAKYSGCYANDANGKARMFTGWRMRINGVDTDDVLFPGQAIDWNYTDNVTLVAQWADTEFSMTTVDTNGIDISIPASGTFYVDWGDGYAQLITRGGEPCDTIGTSSILHEYSEPGSYTIKISGDATGYCSFRDFGISGSAFNVESNTIQSLGGSLGAVFPILGENMGDYPIFMDSFISQENLTTLPDTLFSDYHVARPYMFITMFLGSGLTELPHRLFATIDGAAEGMFLETFGGCENLTTIYGDLFTYIDENNVVHGIQGGANSLFFSTFRGAGLTEIPDGLFIGINQPAEYMFSNTFEGCFNLQSVPSNLFNNCNNGTCTGVTGGAPYMFAGTFANTALSSIGGNNYIPKSMFARLFDDNSPMPEMVTAMFANTQLATQCPADKEYFSTPYEAYWSVEADGDPDPDGDPVRKVVCDELSWHTITYSCGDGDGTAPESQDIQTHGEFTPQPYGNCHKQGKIFVGWRIDTTDMPADIVEEYNKPYIMLFPGQTVYDWSDWYLPINRLVAEYADSQFQIVTTEMAAGDEFTMWSGVAGWTDGDDFGGMYVVNWGDGYTSVMGESHVYVDSGVHTISFARLGNKFISENGENYVGYGDNACGMFAFGSSYCVDEDLSDSFGNRYNDYGNPYISELHGSLGDLFPTFKDANGNWINPNFIGTFAGANNLTHIDPNLFSNIPYVTDYMFASTFSNCESLTTIPQELFAGITGVSKGMFDRTFAATGLTQIPEGLFDKITLSAPYMFYGTFAECGSLTTLPEHLFGNINSSGSAEGMFRGTFGETPLSVVPENLFYRCDSNGENCTGITVAESMTFDYTFYGCELTELPKTLFSKITQISYNGTPFDDEAPFRGTFELCENLGTGEQKYIPYSFMQGLFEADSPIPHSVVAMFDTTQLVSECPIGAQEFSTPYADYWSGGLDDYEEPGEGIVRHVVCFDPCPEGYYCNGAVQTRCPSDAPFSPIGSSDPNDCGHILHIGEYKLYMRKDKKSDHALVVKYNGVPYYGNAISVDGNLGQCVLMSDGVDHCLNVKMGDEIYSVFDDSGYRYTQSQQ